MKKNFIKFGIPAAITSLGLQAATAFAQSDAVQQGLGTISGAFPKGGQNQTLQSVIVTVIQWMLYAAGIVSVLVIIIGGLMYITSAGNDEQAKKGKKSVYNAVIGLVITIFAYVIVQVVYNFFTT